MLYVELNSLWSFLILDEMCCVQSNVLMEDLKGLTKHNTKIKKPDRKNEVNEAC